MNRFSSESESLATKYTRHSFFEIQYALQGQTSMELEESGHLDIRESEFVVVPPNTGHQIKEAADQGARFVMAFAPEFRDAQLRRAVGALEKLKRVEELIVSTQLTFLEIAEVCGFSDGYALNKFFKRHNHVNLSEFRALSRKNKKALP